MLETFITLSDEIYSGNLYPHLLFLPYGDNVREARKQARLAEATRLAAVHGLYAVAVTVSDLEAL